MKLAVAIATTGRAGTLRQTLLATLRELERQTQAPDRVLVCCASKTDVAGIVPPQVELLASPPGLAAQRNALLRAAADCDIVLFLDDDFLAAAAYVEVTTRVMQADPTIAVATGTLIADGATGPGFGVDFGRHCLLADHHPPGDLSAKPWFSGYGCNMAVRTSIVRRHKLSFDERLKLQSCYEDVDFTRRAGRHGRVVKLAGARGVHLGSTGRSSGRRLGYAQVANPVYLAREGRLPWRHTLRSVGRNTAMNAVLSIWPEPHVDRRGRLSGNARAFADLLKGSLAPENAASTAT